MSKREVVEKLRAEMYEYMEQSGYNLTDARVVAKSQELDRALNELGGRR